MIMICTNCKKEKKLDDFHNQKKGKHGKNTQCKECICMYSKKYNKKNKAKINKKNRESKIWIREDVKKNNKKWRENNKDRTKKLKRDWYLKNKDSILDYNRKYIAKKKLTDPEYKLKNNIRKLFAVNFKNQLIKKTGIFFSYTGISFEDYIDYLKEDQLWKNYCNGEDIHLDHIIPVSIYDFRNPEDIKKCWNFRNLRLLPAKENIIKAYEIDYCLIEKHNIFDLMPEVKRAAMKAGRVK